MLKRNILRIFVAYLIGIIMVLILIDKGYASRIVKENNTSPLLSGFVPFLSLVILIGGSILITLSYVSWRKYKANKIKEKLKDHNSNH